ncbi:hypothetical protein KFL_003040120 [Klebsormidium nitens]|uniref:GST N-terminal domain-containing protein n=1 Tax=Klebsormidium nitens TaxID=105231 RepID=A0A1Y1I6V1_KLENI|nr:hypothetical protein KFL_003040120 [Klebsormidium nitens]|eukprot:GAQ86685.1 hypothetical protein KFL_003040120 [Klebsormidium nitens]
MRGIVYNPVKTSKRSTAVMVKHEDAATGQGMQDNVKFYTHTLCPYAHRVALTLIEKGVQAETIHIDLSNKPAWYRKVNPRGLVPALVHGGKTLTESLDLCQYVEEQFPGPALVPATTEERREAERLIGRCDQFVSAGLQFLSDPSSGSWSLPGGQIPVKKTGSEVTAFERELVWLEETLQRHGGPFFMGVKITLVDLVYFPFVDRFALAGPAFVDSSVCALFGRGALQMFLKGIRERDSYRLTSAAPSDHLAGLKKYRSLDYFDYVSASMERPCP